MTRGKLIILLSIFAILSLFSMLTVYYTHQLPTEEIKTTTLCTYKHVGTYDYTAKLKSNIIYNQSELKPGEGYLYTAITEYINTTLSYTFESSQEANITIEYRIDVIFPRWNKIFNILPQTKLNSIGNVSKFSNNYLVNLTSVQEVKKTLEDETRVRASDYNVTIRPEIHTIAKNNITTIDENFTPTMTITFRHGTSEGNYISTTGLEHTILNAITDTEIIPIPGVTNQRYMSYGFCAITFSALAVTIGVYTKTVKPSPKPKKSMEEIVAPYEEAIAESAGEPSYKGQTAIIPMKSLEDLMKVADWLGKPVLSYEKAPSTPSKESTRIFYVLDGTTRYECTITAPTTTEKEEEEAEGD